VSGIQIPYLGYGFMIAGVLLLAIPLWPTIRRFIGNDLEIRITPNKWLDGCETNGKPTENPFYRITPGHRCYALFGLTLANHSQYHRIHIDSANILLRRKTWFWNGKSLFSMPLEIQDDPKGHILNDVDIAPQSKKEYSVDTGGDMPIISPFPRRSNLILSLELVGATRRIEHTLQEFKHDRKQVPDMPDRKKQ